MSPRVLLVLPLALALGCDDPASGPLRTDAKAFVYSATLAGDRTLYLRNGRGSIDVEPSADDSLRIEADISWRGGAERPDGVYLSAAPVPEGLLVCTRFGEGSCTVDDYNIKSRRGNVFGSRGLRVAYRVQVPPGVQLDLLGVDTRITSASTAPVKARTVNGDVTVVTAVGPVRAETINGDVDARMTTLSGSDSVVVKSLNGDAWAFLPESAAFLADLATTNGRAESDFPSLAGASTTRTSIEAPVNGGGRAVRVRTLNGRAGLGRLDAEGRSYQRP